MSRLLETPEEPLSKEKGKCDLDFLSAVFTDRQLLALKYQIMAYKLISRNQKIPPELQRDILKPLDGEYQHLSNNQSMKENVSLPSTREYLQEKHSQVVENVVGDQRKVLGIKPLIENAQLRVKPLGEKQKEDHSTKPLTVSRHPKKKPSSLPATVPPKEQKENLKLVENGLVKTEDLADQSLSRQNKKEKNQKSLSSLVLGFHHRLKVQELRNMRNRTYTLKRQNKELYSKFVNETRKSFMDLILKRMDDFFQSVSLSVVKRQSSIKNLFTFSAEDIQKNDNYYDQIHFIKEKIYQPILFNGGQLSSYQMKGLEWTVSLYNNNANGILVDETSQGKIKQTISLICYLIEAKKSSGPFLIIVHPSAISNWKTEFDRWAPGVKKLLYRGPARDRKILAMKFQDENIRYQVVISSYALITMDKSALSQVKWLYTIVDKENFSMNTTLRICTYLRKEYKTKFRLLLTKTPFQNTLSELWFLLNFLLPKILKTFHDFEEWLEFSFINKGLVNDTKLNKEEEQMLVQRLHTVLGPFVITPETSDDEVSISPNLSSNESKIFEAVDEENDALAGLIHENQLPKETHYLKRKTDILDQNIKSPIKKRKVSIDQDVPCQEIDKVEQEEKFSEKAGKDSLDVLGLSSMFGQKLITTLLSIYWEIEQYVVEDTETGQLRRLCDMFLKLVDKNQSPTYYEIIKKPICMRIILSRIYSGYYRSIQEFQSDFNLMIDNTKCFNEESSGIYKDAVKLQVKLTEEKKT
ncbi:unnamed protein product [Rhizopus stolonifer]